MKKKRVDGPVIKIDMTGYRPGLVYSPGIGWSKPVEPKDIAPDSIREESTLTPKMLLNIGAITNKEYIELIKNHVHPGTKTFAELPEEEQEEITKIFSELGKGGDEDEN